ncbi:unnamed protein product, partial [Rotaria socialis]
CQWAGFVGPLGGREGWLGPGTGHGQVENGFQCRARRRRQGQLQWPNQLGAADGWRCWPGFGLGLGSA